MHQWGQRNENQKVQKSFLNTCQVKSRVAMPASGVAAAKSGRAGHTSGLNSNNTRRDHSNRDRGGSPDGEEYIDTRPVEALLPLSEIRLIDGRKVETVAAELLESEKNIGWVIDPRRSKFIMYWDIITSVALVFTATVTPYEVALLDPRLDVLWIINRLVDSIFGLDIVLAFFTMYEVKSASIAARNEWVSSHWRIAKQYLTGWFALDVFSVGVSAVDIYSVISQLTGRAVDLGELSSLKTLRVLRLFKLVRLVICRTALTRHIRVPCAYSAESAPPLRRSCYPASPAQPLSR